ncbi:hypothetical protein KAU11_10480 [Candidatus Babeliales bacterium]|nr:hypothetical protein [Candidatus Babeliales bacterium]
MKTLPAETVNVKVSEDYVSSWIPEGKDGHKRWESTSTTYDAPLTRSGVKPILTQEEQAFLENRLGPDKPKGWMNPNKMVDNAWTGSRNRFKVAIPFPEGLRLDLSNDIEFIQFKILLANNRDIAESYESSKEGKFLFYLEKESDKNRAAGDKMKIKMAVHSKFAEVSVSFSKIYNFFVVAFRGNVAKLPFDEELEESKIALYEYTEANPQMFLDVLNDKDYKYKVIYFKGLVKGAFVKNNGEIRASYINGASVGRTIEDVVEYIERIEKEENPQEFHKLMERIK